MRVRLHSRLPLLIERATNRVRFFGGGGTSSTNTIQNTTPWAAQQPSLQTLFNQAGTLNAGPGPQYYPWQQVADLTNPQWSDINAIQFAGNNGTPALNTAQSAVSNITGGATNIPAVGNYGLGNQAISSELGGAGIGGMMPAYTQMQGTLGNLAGAGTTASAQPGFNSAESALQGLAGYGGNNGAAQSALGAIQGPLGAGGALANATVPMYQDAANSAARLSGLSNNGAAQSALGAIPGMASGAVGAGLMPTFQTGANALNQLAGPGSTYQAEGGFSAAQNAIRQQAGGAGVAGAQPLAGQSASALQNIASGNSNQALNASQASALGQFTDPSKALTGSIAASVLPQIESQFGAAGGMSNPNAAYAASQGLASALAPYGLQAAQQQANLGMTEQAQRLQAGQTGLSNLAQQLALQQGAAGLGTQAYQGQQGMQLGAGQAAQQAMQAQQGLQQGAAGLGLQAQQQQIGANLAGGQLGAGMEQAQQGLTNQAAGLGLTAQQQQFGANTAGAQLGVGALGQQEQAQLGATGQTNQAMLAQQALQAQAAQQASQNYLQGQGQQLIGAQIAPSLNAATMGNLQSALGASTIPQQQTQAQIDAAMQQWNFNQMQPYNKLALFQGEVGGTGYGSSSTLQQPYFNNTAGQLLSGAAGIGSLLGNTGAFGSGGWLTGAGGLFGGGSALGATTMTAADLAALGGTASAALGGAGAVGSALAAPLMFA